MKRLYWLALALSLSFFSCGNEDSSENNNNNNKGETESTGTFAKGADISWCTEMESSGIKFYSAAGVQTECTALMKSLGMNSIRLRVWVNPTGGWNNKEDVLAKALRAKNLNMRIMIDFHYSDSWADPGKQIKPAAWKSMTLSQLKQAITNHTTEVLNLLKQNNITPEWVQVGNEVSSGLLWDTDASLSGATWDAKYSGVTYKTNETNFAAFLQTGYNAVKNVFPNAKVIIHLPNGQKSDTSTWICDILKKYSVNYDLLGLSLYPSTTSWQSDVAACMANVSNVYSVYGKETMICEVGMDVSQPAICKAFLTSLMSQAKTNGHCLGVFYWEPECYNWNSYRLGAFDQNNKPTSALDAFASVK